MTSNKATALLTYRYDTRQTGANRGDVYLYTATGQLRETWTSLSMDQVAKVAAYLRKHGATYLHSN